MKNDAVCACESMCVVCAYALKYAVCVYIRLPGVCLSVFGIFFSIETTATNFISIYSMPKFDRQSFPTHNFEPFEYIDLVNFRR